MTGVATPLSCPAPALRAADRFTDPPLAELGAAALHLVRHHDQVALGALAVAHVVLHESLDAEAEALEDVDRALLIGRHLRHDLLDAALQRLEEDRLNQSRAEPQSPVLGIYDHPNLADVR